MDRQIIESLLKPHTASKSLLYTRTQFFVKLMKDLKVDDLSILGDTDKTLKYLNSGDVSIATVRNKILHIIAMLKILNLSDSATIKTYQTQADDLKKPVQEIYLNNKMTDKEKAKYQPLPELQRKLKEHLKKVSANLENGEQVSYSDMKELQKLIILGFYVLMPPLRDDLKQLKYMRRTIGVKKDQNYFIHATNGNMFFYLNQYKTAKTLGHIKISIDDPTLKQAINLFINKLAIMRQASHPGYLFFWNFKNKGKPELSSNLRSISSQLSTWSNAYLGTKLGINDFRHIYEMNLQRSPEYQQMTQAEKNKAHKQMLHSPAIAQVYNKAD